MVRPQAAMVALCACIGAIALAGEPPAAKYAKGDKVALKGDSAERVVCGIDAESLLEYSRIIITFDVDPADLDPATSPVDRKLSEMFKAKKLVRLEGGAVGEVLSDPTSKRIERVGKLGPITAHWIKVKFETGAVFVPLEALQKAEKK